MLRRRLVTTLTLNDGVLFRTRNFVPDYRYTLNFVDAWGVDEVVALDVTRPGQGERAHFFRAVEELARTCFVPLAAGGGVLSVEEVRALLRLGADKVVVNTAAVERPEFLAEVAEAFGAQCMVLAIDARRDERGSYEVMTHQGTRPTGLDPVAWAREGERRGAGEVLLTSIERDGTLEGYDNALNRRVSDAVGIPVLVCGGAGQWQHFVDGFVEGGASAVCTTNIYHFTEASVRSAKRHLERAGVPVRT